MPSFVPSGQPGPGADVRLGTTAPANMNVNIALAGSSTESVAPEDVRPAQAGMEET